MEEPPTLLTWHLNNRSIKEPGEGVCVCVCGGGGGPAMILTCAWVSYRAPCTVECPCEERQGLKTLPDFISRSAEHSLWDGDIYMALYMTASCCRPKALAASGTGASEWGANASRRTRRRWLMCCAEDERGAHAFMLKGLYHISHLSDKDFSPEEHANICIM